MSEPVVWNGFTQDALDAAYNNMAAVPDSAARLSDWTARSQALREQEALTLSLSKGEGDLVLRQAQHEVAPTPDPSRLAAQAAGGGESVPRPSAELDIPYGTRPRNGFDLYRCGLTGAPLFVFIHGGYWQRNSKEVFGCMAMGPLAAGFDVAVIGYTLAPEAQLSEIVEEVSRAVDAAVAARGPGGPVIVGGWSAGGHLAAMALEHERVAAALAISGIFELEPIRASYLDAALRLTDDEIARLSPIRRPHPGFKPLVCAYGGAELPELQRQSRDFVETRRAAGAPVDPLPLARHDHFSILEELAEPGGWLIAALWGLAAVRPARG